MDINVIVVAVCFVIILLQEVLHCVMRQQDSRKWDVERQVLIDRIMSVDYTAFKVIGNKKEKPDEKKPETPELV